MIRRSISTVVDLHKRQLEAHDDLLIVYAGAVGAPGRRIHSRGA
jgi:hypothetical protein